MPRPVGELHVAQLSKRPRLGEFGEFHTTCFWMAHGIYEAKESNLGHYWGDLPMFFLLFLSQASLLTAETCLQVSSPRVEIKPQTSSWGATARTPITFRKVLEKFCRMIRLEIGAFLDDMAKGASKLLATEF